MLVRVYVCVYCVYVSHNAMRLCVCSVIVESCTDSRLCQSQRV